MKGNCPINCVFCVCVCVCERVFFIRVKDPVPNKRHEMMKLCIDKYIMTAPANTRARVIPSVLMQFHELLLDSGFEQLMK